MFPGGHVVSMDDGGIVASLSAWAREFGVHYETVRRGLMERGAKPVGKHRGHDQFLCRDVVAALSGSATAVDPEKLSPFNRRAWYQAELDQLKLQQNRGELIPRLEVEQELASVLKIMSEVFDTLPDIVERDAGATPAQLARLEQALDRAREEMHARLTEQTAEEQAAAPTGTPPQKPAAAPRAAASSGALDAAGAYLSEALGAGPRLAAELIAESAARHISETSLRRAKAKLGILARRAGKGWEWLVADQNVQDGQAS